jgi:flavin-dependent dehydrogenase
MDMTLYDACIIGGGPTGLATAIQSKLKGLNICVFEPKSGVIDKACGEGLMPSAVTQLQEMGVFPEYSHDFLGIRYIEQNGQHADGYFSQGPGKGVRRLALHKALLDRLTQLEIPLFNKAVSNIEEHDNYVQVEHVKCKYVVAADGLHSPIRKQLQLQLPPKRRIRLGIRRHYKVKPWSDFVEVYWSEQAEAYVTPVSDDQVGVAILFYKDHAPTGSDKYEQLLKLFPRLNEHLGESPPSSHIRGAGPFEQRVSKGRKGRFFLVGDAAGYLDPLTGEGIKLGLDGAKAVVNCIVENKPKSYISAHKKILRKYWLMTDGLLRLRQIPFLRKLMIPFLRKTPKVFSIIISILAA